MLRKVDGRIDKKLNKFVKEGRIRPLERYSKKWWTNFVELISSEDAEYVLSFEQAGNWNLWLYEACMTKNRVFLIAE